LRDGRLVGWRLGCGGLRRTAGPLLLRNEPLHITEVIANHAAATLPQLHERDTAEPAIAPVAPNCVD
jgi:hypothetical protein